MGECRPPHLQFEFAQADSIRKRHDDTRSRRVLRRAGNLKRSLSSAAYEIEWAKLLNTTTYTTQRLGWQLLSASRPQVQ